MLSVKKYQEDVLTALENYLDTIQKYKEDRADQAFYRCTHRGYKSINGLRTVPYICIKVPTGGGKTLIACHAIDYIYRLFLMDRGKTGIVMWLTPSDIIRRQTLDKFKDRNHPYREVLDMHFNGRVKVFDAEEALRITKNDVDNYLCVLVATVQSFKREEKKSLRNYRANGSLLTHFEKIKEEYLDTLDKYENSNQPIESLANVIKMSAPLVVIDEGHNVKSDLSEDMLRDLNPSFIIEYTATPRKGSNVIVSIGAHRLKEEEMVKIPIYVTLHQDSWEMAISDAIDKRNELEQIAKEEQKQTGEYVRPILLLQAQNKSKHRDTITIDAVRNFLIQKKNIPEHMIAIRDSDHHEIDNVNLFSSDCNIKYIITVKALSEGWDCSFAYILASVAHKRSTLDVAQILGRILRLPNAKSKSDEVLNCSYVFTSSSDTEKTLESVIEALQGYGYDEYALRKGSGSEKPEKTRFKKIADDNDVNIPLYSVKKQDNSIKPLGYRSDLCIGFSLESEGYKVVLSDLEDMITEIVEIDVKEKEKNGQTIVVKRAFDSVPADINLSLLDDPRGKLIADVSNSIQFGNITKREIVKYVIKIIDLFLEQGKATLEQLIYHKYHFARVIKSRIQTLLDTYTKRIFKKLRSENKLSASSMFDFADEIEIFLHEKREYKKHFYERAYYMNSEEKEVADELERCDNLLWWLRNIERKGFYLQGYLKGRFYPDFIAKTKKGNYFVVEYKGEHLITAEEAEYKNQIGKIWQDLTPKNYFFRMIEKNQIDELIELIKNS